MKVAISSGSFDPDLATGHLTQLEWVEQSASALGADGVVFDRAHFPRTDAEYLAQLRKIAVDVGLVPVAVVEPRLFAPDLPDGERRAAVDLAAALGCLFVMCRLPPAGDVPPATFVAAVAAAKSTVRAAKTANVTLLAGLAPGSLGDDVAALRHFLKDVDSAWLRYALPAGADGGVLGARDRTLVVTVDPAADAAALDEIDDTARPWLVLTGEVSAARVAALRRAAAKKTLERTSVP